MDQAGFGVIGLGTWGKGHARVYNDDPRSRLVAVCDIRQDRANEIGAQYKAERVLTDFRDLLKSPEIDAVSIVTPDFLHRDIAVAAAEAGKHILLEKPMATSVKECEEIIAAVEKAGVKLMVDYHNRWDIPLLTTKNRLKAGEFGRPLMIYLRLSDTILVPTQMLSWAANSSVAWFIGSHSVDLVRWLFEDEVARVYSVSRSTLLKQRGIDTPDFFNTILELKGGGTAMIENCWILQDSLPAVADFRVELVCEKATVQMNILHSDLCRVFTEDAKNVDTLAALDVYGRPQGFAHDSIRYFVGIVTEDLPLLVTGQDRLVGTTADQGSASRVFR